MSLKYVYKDFVVCYLVIFLANNAVADMSLDYYFGFEEPLRLSLNIIYCRTKSIENDCHEKCGPTHACLLGKCFCVKVNPPIEEILSKELSSIEESSVENTGGEDTSGEDSREDFSLEKIETENLDDDEEDKQEAPPGPASISFDEELANRPALRHQIAHFCPNLDVARKCIRQCMQEGKPAFCGKDHVCYCGHQYDFPHKKVKLVPDAYREYRDFYEKYFGPEWG